MPLEIDDPETQRLAAEVARMTGESPTGAIRSALRERKERLVRLGEVGDRERELRALLEQEIWPSLPAEQLGRAPGQAEQDDILGYEPASSSVSDPASPDRSE